MDLTIFNTIDDLMLCFGFKEFGIVYGDDGIYIQENDTDKNGRKIKDAEVLATIAKNIGGDLLEIGTSTGHGTYRLAVNTNGKVYTLNALPEQIGGNNITHILKKEEIGSFLREKKISNYEQIYENSLRWIPDAKLLNSVGLAFIDGCHDTEYVLKDSLKAWSCLKEGGFLIWHDFNPELRGRFQWIDAAMRGVEIFLKTRKPETKVYHLRNSFIGMMRKMLP